MNTPVRWVITVALIVGIFLMSLAYSSELNVPLDTLAKRHRNASRSLDPEDPVAILFKCIQVRSADHPTKLHVQQTFIPSPEHCVGHHTQNTTDPEHLARINQYNKTGHMFLATTPPPTPPN